MFKLLKDFWTFRKGKSLYHKDNVTLYRNQKVYILITPRKEVIEQLLGIEIGELNENGN